VCERETMWYSVRVAIGVYLVGYCKVRKWLQDTNRERESESKSKNKREGEKEKKHAYARAHARGCVCVWDKM